MINLFKKTTILIIMLAIFMAPISAGININKNRNLKTSIKIDIVSAQTPGTNNATTKLSGGETIEASTPSQGIGYASAIFDLKIKPIDLSAAGNHEYKIETSIIEIKNSSVLTPEQEKNQTISSVLLNTVIYKDKLINNEKNIRICYGIGLNCPKDTSEIIKTDATTLKEDTDYKLKVKLSRNDLEDTATYYWTFRTGNKANKTSGETTGDIKSYNQTEESFNCGIGGVLGGNLGGCVLQILYYLWQGTALIAELAGHFLDFFVYYATNSTSYFNTFVEKAWAAVRDIANVFFIIALFYVAVKTILGLNVSNNKKLVGMVIAIGLVINFSLFTTKLVIDGSNILAKVFYNNISSKYDKEKNSDGTAKEAIQKDGQKSISVGLIDKFNPQNIVMESYNSGLGLGYAIFIIILLMGITLYTAYIFFSVALLFVARVVSLWLSMIFSPIAFASYTVPFEIPGFGHKEWWGELIKNAMLAPIFIFLLYIIVLFAGFLGEIVKYTNDSDTMQRLMAIVIPFIILMALLKKSKVITQQYAGEMGKAIVGGAAVLGGLALGGTAMLGAAAGRATIGSFMKGASSGETATQRLQRGESLGKWDKIKGKIGNKIGIDKLQRNVGGWINKDQEKVEHAAHARHELDKESETKYHKKFNELTAPERTKIQAKITQDHEAEKEYGKKYNQLDATKKTAVENIISRKILNGEETKGDEYLKESRKKQTLWSSVKQSSRAGSYDIRGLSNVLVKEQTTLTNKITSGITGTLAKSIRGGLKGALNINYGESQKSFLKDLGNTISEALKGAKVNVDLSHVGHEEKEDAHGGHGGGGHH